VGTKGFVISLVRHAPYDSKVSSTLHRCDVAVIGGGPAGACCAIKLAAIGYRVTLIDKGSGRNQHRGESLPSSIRVVVDALEIELPPSIVVARPPEHLVYWGEMQGESRPAAASETSFLVWRGPFDALLRKTAVARGVRLEHAAVHRQHRSGNGHEVHYGDGESLECRFLVDASGRAGVRARHYRRRETAFRTISQTAHFQTDEAAPPTIVEAIPDGWIWSAPLDNGLRDVTIMLDAYVSHQTALEASTVVRRLVGSSPLVEIVRGIDATPYSASRFCDRRVLLVGDAGSFLDPLSAHGVHKAMDGALIAATVIHTTLERPAMEADAAGFYDAREKAIYKVTMERLARLYAQESRYAAQPFWRKRARGSAAAPSMPDPRSPLRPEMKLRSAEGVEVVDAPVLEGDFIERRAVLVGSDKARPVRFSGAISLPELFQQSCDAENAAAAARASGFRFDEAYRAIDWLYRSGFLQDAGSLIE